MSKIELNKDLDFPSGLVLPINKPYGWTSADVVRRVCASLKYLGYKKIKVGHAGTLDPLATGILLICIGKATKQAESLQAETKEYVCEVQLGATTPCFDMEHEIDATYPYEHITKEKIEEVLKTFIGEQEQVPPIYSAKSINGKRAYEYARAGEHVEMRKAIVSIYEIELQKIEMPKVQIRLACSKGTYIRSFARDLGVSLESGGFLTALCRTRNGGYTLDDCFSMDEVIEILKKV